MEKSGLVFSLLCGLLMLCDICSTHKKNYVDDYCWRDYEGITPQDALKSGLDSRARPIYVGQVLYENKLIPGKIIEGNPKIYFEWYDKEYSRTQNIKILCTNHPEKFQWLPTKNDQVSLLTNKILVKGGFETNYSTYIGRVFTSGETLVGKVMCKTDKCFGLYTTREGHYKEHKVFEILSYNPDNIVITTHNSTASNVTNVNLNPPIDVRYN